MDIYLHSTNVKSNLGQVKLMPNFCVEFQLFGINISYKLIAKGEGEVNFRGRKVHYNYGTRSKAAVHGSERQELGGPLAHLPCIRANLAQVPYIR